MEVQFLGGGGGVGVRELQYTLQMARSKMRISRISDFISPIFINPCFRYSPIVNIENLDLKNSNIFKHPCF